MSSSGKGRKAGKGKGAKKAGKKQTKATGSVQEPLAYHRPRSVSIDKAANGFVIRTYKDTGEAIEVAKTIKEANQIAAKILEQ